MTCLCSRVPSGKRCVFCWYAAGAPGLPTAAERETEDRERRQRLATPGAYAVEDTFPMGTCRVTGCTHRADGVRGKLCSMHAGQPPRWYPEPAALAIR